MSSITHKRLIGEIKALHRDKISFAQAYQDESNPFLFYFLLIGDKDSDYKGGYYIGKIMLPEDYPNKPGDFMMLTPNGRFTINSKICLSNTGYHKDTWSPLWTISNMIKGFYSIFMDDAEHGISHIKESSGKRIAYAQSSVEFNMKNYSSIFINFNQFVNESGVPLTQEELDELAQQDLLKKKKKHKVIDPVVTEPIKTEPIKTEPIATEPVANKLVVIEPIANKLVVTEPIANKLIVTEPVANKLVVTEPIANKLVVTEPVANKLVAPNIDNNDKIFEDKVLQAIEESLKQNVEPYADKEIEDLVLLAIKESLKPIIEPEIDKYKKYSSCEIIAMIELMNINTFDANVFIALKTHNKFNID